METLLEIHSNSVSRGLSDKFPCKTAFWISLFYYKKKKSLSAQVRIITVLCLHFASHQPLTHVWLWTEDSPPRSSRVFNIYNICSLCFVHSSWLSAPTQFSLSNPCVNLRIAPKLRLQSHTAYVFDQFFGVSLSPDKKKRG